MPISYSVKKAAQECSLSERTLRAAIKDGRLKSSRVGRRVLISPKDLEKFLSDETRKANHD